MTSRWTPEIANFVTESLDQLQLGIAVFDACDRLTYCNSHFPRIYRSLAELGDLEGVSFKALLERIVQDGEIGGSRVMADPTGWIEQRLRRHRSPTEQPVEERLADGRWIEVKERALPEGGRIGIWQDITALRTCEIRLDDAVSMIAEGFALWDQSDRLLLHNDAFQDFFAGCRTPPKRGDSFAQIMQSLIDDEILEKDNQAPAQVEGWREAHRQLFGRTVIRRRDQHWFLVKERRTRDGGSITFLSDFADLKSSDSTAAGRGHSIERTIGDLTQVQAKLAEQGGELGAMAEELAYARRAVEQADASKTRFLRSISHELRTPLNAIIGFSEVLRDELLGPLGHGRYQEYAGDIHASGSHLLALVNQLLDLSRIEAGRYELEPEPHKAVELVQDAIRLMSKQIEDAGLELVNRVKDSLEPVMADRQAVRQILVNLLSNAVKFTPAGGEILIDADCEGDSLVFTVTDTGIGIPADKMSRLMRPFERVDNSLERETEGTGLGLAISRSLAEMHGGTLQLESALAEGTKAVLRLPLAGQNEQTASPLSTARTAGVG